MITLNFSVDDQLLTRTDENTVAANSHLVHVCEFAFSSEWDNRGKVATFKKRDLVLSVILDDDACTIPPEILQSENKIDVFELSVCGADGNSTITSTVVKVPILAGTWDVMSTEITPTMFEQIMQKIDEVEKGEVSPELIYEAVSEYMEAHPLEPIVAEDVAAYFEEHKSEFKGDTGATPEITATAEVNNAVGTPSVTVTKTGTAEAPNLNFAFQNLKGAKGDTGVTPTISAAATVDANVGAPSVTVTKSGTTENPNLAFAFHNLKGVKGDTGNGIASIVKTATSGLVDTYTITYTDGTTSIFEVTNGEGANEVWKAQEFLGVKNLLPYPYKNGEKSVTVQGITFTENEGVIYMSGTATNWAAYQIVYKKAVAPFKNGGAYRVYFADESIHSGINFQILGILADNSSDTLVNIADVQSHEMRITKDYVSYTIAIVVSPNIVLDDDVVHPMIQFLTDDNMFWAKPVKTNTELTDKLNSITDIWDIQGEMGAKNILPTPYTDQSGIDTNGITLTYDSDGVITLNGTSTNYAVFNLFLGAKLFEENRKYTCYFKEQFSSLPSGVGVQIWSLNAGGSNKNNYTILNNTLLEPGVFTYTDSEDTLCTVRIVVNPSVTLSNMKLHVMLQHTEDPYNVWVPYAKTNKKLTEDIERIDNIINDIPAQNVASITCWGDSLTAMNGWTQKLATLSGLPVYNGGTGGENSKCIMARQGGDVMIVDGITIPATTTPVLIATRAEGGIDTQLGNKVMPLLQGGAHVNPVMLGDIAGTLAWTGSDYADQNGTWTFTRATAGEEIVINRPTAIRTNFDINHNGKNELMIIFMGQNGGWNDNADLIHQHKLMIDHFKGKEYVVLGLSSGTATSRADYEAAMKEAFGRRFISLREYLAHPIYENGEIVSCYGLADQGLTPTADDLEKIAIGQVPASCLADSVHYTVGTREVIGNMLYHKLKELNIL